MRDMTTGSPIKHVLLFSLPMVLGAIFQQLYNTVDTIIVGRFVSAEALAAVGAAGAPMFFVASFLIGLTIGVSVIISQLFGAGEYGQIKRTFSTAIIAIFVLTLVLSAVGHIVKWPLLRLLNTPDEVIGMSIEYLEVIFSGMIFVGVYNLFTSVLRGIGDSKTPLYFLMLSSVLNIALDLFFVINLQMGVRGVAFATIVSQLVAAVLCFVYTFWKSDMLRLTRQEFRFERDIFMQILRFGLPTAIQQTVMSFSMMLVTGLVNSFGTVTMAAYTSGNKIETFVSMPAMNIGNALSTFVGQNTGAGKPDRVRSGFKRTVLVNGVFSMVMAAFIIPFSSYLIMIFIDPSETAIIAQGSEYLNVMFALYFMQTTMFCLGGFFRGVGDMRSALIVTFANLAGRVGSAYLLAPYIQHSSIWVSLPIGWTLGILMGVIFYRSGSWTKYGVIQRSAEEELPAQDISQLGEASISLEVGNGVALPEEEGES